MLIDSVLHDVSDFHHLAPNKRPAAICPICDEKVILKLGYKYAHHYSHKTNFKCIAHDAETAEHLNTKFHIYHELQKGNELIITQKCKSNCGRTNEHIWTKDWTQIKVEYSLNPKRPDITIFKNSDVIAAIEIRMWHAVEMEKQKVFEAMNLRWVEVRANRNLYEGDNKWTINQPLPFEKIFPENDWECHFCSEYNKQKLKDYDLSDIWKEFDDKRMNNKAPLNKRIGICIYCGNSTIDWWYYDGSSDNCKCRSCLRKGLV